MVAALLSSWRRKLCKLKHPCEDAKWKRPRDDASLRILITVDSEAHVRLTSNAHRELLCGLLALRAQMIDQTRLLTAFSVWAFEGESRPIADVLVEHGLDASQRDALESMVSDHLVQNGGDIEKSLAAMAADDSTRDALQRLDHHALDQSLHHVSPRSDENETTTPRIAPALDLGTTTSGRFRVVRTHRRGGLGIVFVAIDSELNREVALKQIRDEHAHDEHTRKRFLLEAEITAGLEHPGIVPVYGLGNDPSGRPFYAMRLIDGENLKDVVIEFHRRKRSVNKTKSTGKKSSIADRSIGVELNKLLRRFLDVCNAIEYAHEKGVLHRDLKPGNILIGKHGETLVVDWGLAKPVGGDDSLSANGAGRSLMLTGRVETIAHSRLGTPAYMSPEQARGELDKVGIAADVYGLGASLYYLLTGQPPFLGGEVRAVLDGVIRGDFPAPRKVDPSIDRGLEAICLKAMATSPEDRYASARALADDIERWLADEPVAAIKDTRARKIARWSRHHMLIVASACVALVTMMAALVVIVGLVVRQNARLVEAKEEVVRQSQMADLMALHARTAVNDMLTDVARTELLDVPQGTVIRLRLAERAAKYIASIKARSRPDALNIFSEAKIAREIGFIYMITGEYEKAERSLDGAIESLTELLREFPQNASYINTLTLTLCSRGRTIIGRGGPSAEIEAYMRKAVNVADTLGAIEKRTPVFVGPAGMARYELALALLTAGSPEAAEPVIRDALSVALHHRKSYPEKLDPKVFTIDYLNAPRCRVILGQILLRLDRPEWKETIDESIRELKALRDIYPVSGDTRFQLLVAERTLQEGLGRNEAAWGKVLGEYDRLVSEMEGLIQERPFSPGYSNSLTSLRSDRGEWRISAGRFADAETDLLCVLERSSDRLTREPKSIPAIRQLAEVKYRLAVLEEKRGKTAEARNRIVESLELYQKAIDLDPENQRLKQLKSQAKSLQDRLRG